MCLKKKDPQRFLYTENRKEYALCTQRKIDYFMMKYWIERELGF